MPNKKILIVDDSKTAMLMAKMMIQKGPYDIITAVDGAEAVQKAFTETPDLILMDVVMPKMTGFEACRALRADERTRITPIILLTTRGEEQNIEAGYQAGCNDYVTKPLDAPALMTKLRAYLGA